MPSGPGCDFQSYAVAVPSRKYSCSMYPYDARSAGDAVMGFPVMGPVRTGTGPVSRGASSDASLEDAEDAGEAGELPQATQAIAARAAGSPGPNVCMTSIASWVSDA